MTYNPGDCLLERTKNWRTKVIKVTGSEFDRQYLMEVELSPDTRQIGTRYFASEHTLDTRYQKVIPS